jgi:hypothetical protein
LRYCPQIGLDGPTCGSILLDVFSRVIAAMRVLVPQPSNIRIALSYCVRDEPEKAAKQTNCRNLNIITLYFQ